MRERGLCLACGYHVRLRKSGFPERHYIYSGRDKYACPGGEAQRLMSDTPRFPKATFLQLRGD